MMKFLRALLIEDSESDAGLILRQLEKGGFQVSSRRVDSIELIKDSLYHQEWDIVIADYQLAGFTATVAFEILKESGRDIPFIVVSGAIGEETAVALMRMGACDYLMKNNLVRLASVVERELTEVQIRRERSMALRALLESENNLRKSQKVAHVGHWVIDRINNQVDCSEEFLRIFDINRFEYEAEFIQAVKNSIHPEDFAKAKLLLEGFKNCNAPSPVDFRVVHRNGSIHYISGVAGECIINENGELLRVSGVVQDITQRKLAEKELQQWADAFQHCGQGIAMSNPQKNEIIACNPAFAKIRGGQVETVVNRPILNLYPLEEHESVKRWIDEADKRGQVRFESNMLSENGEVFPVQIDLVSVRDDEGISLYRVATLQDLTRRKRAENALRKEMEESRKRAHELEIISDVSSSMRQARDAVELSQIMIDRLTQLLNARYATLAFLAGEGLDSICEQDVSIPGIKYFSIEDAGMFDKVIDRGQPLVIEKWESGIGSILPTWLGLEIDSGNLTSLIAHPLKLEAKTIGVIFLAFDNQKIISHEISRLVTAVADMAGSALNRMKAVENLEVMVRRREKELESIYQITSAASQTLDIQEALQQALVYTLEAVQVINGGIYLLDEINQQSVLSICSGSENDVDNCLQSDERNEFIGRVSLNKKPLVIPCSLLTGRAAINIDDHECWLIGLPMRIKDRVIGVLLVLKKSMQQVNVEEMTLLSFIADQLALIVENTRLYKKAERSAIVSERSRLARELHDSVTQSLYSANLYSVGAQRFIEQQNYQQVGIYLKEIGELTYQSLRDMRLMVYELRSPELIKSGLLGALQNRLDSVERRSNRKVSLDTNLEFTLPEQVEENLYWIIIEALNNSLKYSQATEVSIGIRINEETLDVSIIDNGIGFDHSIIEKNGGMGMATMRERTETLSGSLEIDSKAGKGTRVNVALPVSSLMKTKSGG